MTNEDWQCVKDNVGLFRTVALRCDGYNVDLCEERMGNKIVIAIYVDGYMKGKWLNGDCEIGRKFMRPKTWYVLSKKQREEFKKIVGARRYKKERERYEEKLTTYYPYWTNINSLIRHLKKNCESIELIKG